MATWRYKKPDSTGHRGLKALLKYVTFREDAHHVIPEDGMARWVNGGLGSSWREVFETSRSLAGEYILAHHFVISPDPNLMALLPEDLRRAALQELTIQTLANWYQARDYALPEASFVIHNRETTDAEAPGRQMLHTHVFAAGTIPSMDGRECPMVKERDVVRNKGGLDRETNLNRIAEQTWAGILDREIGLEWRIGRDLDRHLTIGMGFRETVERTVEKQPERAQTMPNGIGKDPSASHQGRTMESLPAPRAASPVLKLDRQPDPQPVLEANQAVELDLEMEPEPESEPPSRSYDIGFF